MFMPSSCYVLPPSSLWCVNPYLSNKLWMLIACLTPRGPVSGVWLWLFPLNKQWMTVIASTHDNGAWLLVNNTCSLANTALAGPGLPPTACEGAVSLLLCHSKEAVAGAQAGWHQQVIASVACGRTQTFGSFPDSTVQATQQASSRGGGSCWGCASVKNAHQWTCHRWDKGRASQVFPTVSLGVLFSITVSLQTVPGKLRWGRVGAASQFSLVTQCSPAAYPVILTRAGVNPCTYDP